VHRLEGEDDRVRGYRILAPTEWNFHPDGVVVQGLAAIARDLPSSADEASLRDRAVLYVTAVDPCVPYRLVIDSRG
jgi:coenzyme F420-reducing hydrogenase alpha subunit